MNKELLLELIYVATIASIISSQVIQKIKQTLNLCKGCNKIASIVISLGIGFCYAISFYSSNLLYAGWIALFTLVGAEGLYKIFKGYFGLDSVRKDTISDNENKKDN